MHNVDLKKENDFSKEKFKKIKVLYRKFYQ